MFPFHRYSGPYAWFGIFFLTCAVIFLVAANAGTHWVELDNGNQHASPWEACYNVKGRRCGAKTDLDLNKTRKYGKGQGVLIPMQCNRV